MIIPKLDENKMQASDSYFGETLRDRGAWTTFWQNASLGMRLDTSVGYLSNNSIFSEQSVYEEGNVALSATEWRSSNYYRPGLRYQKGMTQYQASLYAQRFDDIEYIKYLNSTSTGFGSGVSKFTGRIAGNFVDPINFIPLSGALYKIGKVGRIGSLTLKDGAVIGAAEVGLATLIAEPFVRKNWEMFGDSRTITDTLMDVTFGMGFGAAVGAIATKIKLRSKNINDIEGHMTGLEQADFTKASSSAVNQVVDGDVVYVGESAVRSTNTVANRIVKDDPALKDAGEISVAAEKGEPEVLPAGDLIDQEVKFSDLADDLDKQAEFEGINIENKTVEGVEDIKDLSDRLKLDKDEINDLNEIDKAIKDMDKEVEIWDTALKCVLGRI